MSQTLMLLPLHPEKVSDDVIHTAAGSAVNIALYVVCATTASAAGVMEAGAFPSNTVPVNTRNNSAFSINHKHSEHIRGC